ncbi:CobW family GTP-binding protein [Longispora albida]|uniref:CobW family GTP-binding protein n=1 Tax=Longispora albida TaxID=203523 RepID=UPI0003768F1C|nr:GTP-binding protein [Longispora albida]
MREVRLLTDLRPAVTVVGGFSAEASGAAAGALLETDPSLVVIRHALTGGTVHRLVWGAEGVLEDERVDLVHGCVSCTLREDVLPAMVRLARRFPARDQVLVLPAAVEPEAVAEACGHCLVDGAPAGESVRITTYVTVADAASFLADLTSEDELRHRGAHAADDDNRGVADVVARQVEYADVVWLHGSSPDGAYGTAQLRVLLRRLAPWAALAESPAEVLGRRDHSATRPAILARGLEGYLVGASGPADCDIVSTVYATRRPFHAERLHESLEEITAGCVRSRGHMWLASQPGTVVAWESAGGGVALSGLGRWLASLPGDHWTEASPYRQITAAAHWDPYYGDRCTRLAFTGVDLDIAALRELLDSCLLTDAELSEGMPTWITWDDPFTGCFTLERT